MIKRINVLELASELAHHAMINMIANGEDGCYKDPKRDTLEYTEEAQEIFNEEYCFYWDLIIQIAESDENNT